MFSVLQPSDYAVIGSMLAVSASVGVYFRFSGGRQKTIEEYLMAEKSMSVTPVSFSLMATFMSAITILGLPAEVYMYGTQYSLWMVGMTIGAIIAAYGFLPVFFDLDVSTTYEYLKRRFGKKTRSFVALLFVLEMIFYTASVIFAPAQALYTVTGLSTWTMITLIIAVATFYCYLGGIKAVMWTDVFQAILMYIPLIAIIGWGSLHLGFLEVFKISNDGGRLIFFNFSPDMTIRYTFWNSIIDGVVFGGKVFGENQAEIQRIMSTGNVKKGRQAIYWSLPLILVFNAFSYWCGLVVFAMYHNCDPLLDPSIHLASPDQIVPYSIIQMFGGTPGFTGFCMAGILSAALSSVSSIMNSLCAVLLEDFIKPFCSCKGQCDSWMSLTAKLLTLVFGALCFLTVFLVSNFRGLMEAMSVLKGFLSGPVFGVYVLGMFTVTANEFGTLVGLIAGLSTSAWIAFGTYLSKVRIPHLPISTDGCPIMVNGTYGGHNSVTFMSGNHTNITFLPDEYINIFPVYKLSYVWIASIGAATTFIVGYLISLIASYWISSPEIHLECLSPFVRKFHISSVTTDNVKENKKVDIFRKKTTHNNNDELMGRYTPYTISAIS